MKNMIYIFLLMPFWICAQEGSNVYISEINYLGSSDYSSCDGTSNDHCRGIELSGPDGTSVDNWYLVSSDCDRTTILGTLAVAGEIVGQFGGYAGSIWYDYAQLSGSGGEVRLYNPNGELIDSATYGVFCDGSDDPSDAGIQTDPNCSLQSFGLAGNEVWGGSLAVPLTFVPSPGEYNGDEPQSCQSTALAVELIDFSANYTNNATILRWSTASEINNSHFVVERSTDGQTFAAIAQVAGAGKAAQYQYVDPKAPQGLTYYRLMQVDNSGATASTKVVSVQAVNSEATLSVFPNPATNQLTVLLPKLYEVATVVEVYDAVGSLVHRQTVAAQSLTARVEVNNLTKGHYYVRLVNGTEISSQRFVKQ